LRKDIRSLLADYAHMALRITPAEWAAFAGRKLRWRLCARRDIRKACGLERRLAATPTEGDLVSVLGSAMNEDGGFHFAPTERRRLAATAQRVCPEYIQQVIAEAELVLNGQGRFELLHREALDRRLWLFESTKDPDTAYRLNRFRYLRSLSLAYVYTGEEPYAEGVAALLESWLGRADPGDPFYWDPLSIAVRVDSWLWALALTEGARSLAPAFRRKILSSILAQVWFLERHLETEPATNHVIFEVKTLLLCGILLQRDALGQKWLRRGRDLLRYNLKKQFHPDGVHWEQSPYYHLLVTNEIIESLAILARAGWEEPDARSRLPRLAAYIRDLLLPHGRIPLMGDSFDRPGVDAPVEIVSYPLPGDILLGGATLLNDSSIAGGIALGDVVSDRMIWVLGEQVTRTLNNPGEMSEARSTAYHNGGVYIMRSPDRCRALLVDCGPLGARPNPGHGHADALSVLLADSGGMILTDPGAFTYAAGRWRSYFRSSSAHNTVVVDGLDQAPQRRAFRFGRPYQASCRQWTTGLHFDFFEGEHDGYRRLPGQVLHRRQVLFVGKRHVLVHDVLEGQGSHSIEVLFHFDPRWDCRPIETGVWEFQDGGGHGLLICWVSSGVKQTAFLEKGLSDPIAGWVSLQHGQKNPAYRARFCVSGRLPLVVSSLLLLQPQRDDLGSLQLESCLLSKTSTTKETGFLVKALCGSWRMVYLSNPDGREIEDSQLRFQGRLGFYAENAMSGGRAAFFQDTRLFSMDQAQIRPPKGSSRILEFWEGDPWETRDSE